MDRSMMRRCIPILLATFLISGCATSYQPMGLRGGYSDMQLSDGIYQVTFKGNYHTSEDKVQKYLLYRAAQITQQNGYKYFLIINGNQSSNEMLIGGSEFNNTWGSASTVGYGNTFNTSANASGYSFRAPFKIRRAYTNTIIIKLLNDNKKYPGAYKSEAIINSAGI